MAPAVGTSFANLPQSSNGRLLVMMVEDASGPLLVFEAGWGAGAMQQKCLPGRLATRRVCQIGLRVSKCKSGGLSILTNHIFGVAETSSKLPILPGKIFKSGRRYSHFYSHFGFVKINNQTEVIGKIICCESW